MYENYLQARHGLQPLVQPRGEFDILERLVLDIYKFLRRADRFSLGGPELEYAFRRKRDLFLFETGNETFQAVHGNPVGFEEGKIHRWHRPQDLDVMRSTCYRRRKPRIEKRGIVDMRFYLRSESFIGARRPRYLLIPQLLKKTVESVGGRSLDLDRGIMPDPTRSVGRLGVPTLCKIDSRGITSKTIVVAADHHLEVHRAESMAQRVQYNLVIHPVQVAKVLDTPQGSDVDGPILQQVARGFLEVYQKR